MKNTLFFLCLLAITSSCKMEKKQAIASAQLVAEKESQPTNRVAQILEQLKNPSEDYVIVVSHRGDWRYAPENSVEAVQRCIDLGVDIVEIDVRLTKDGYLVAMHDKTVDRTTNGTGLLNEMSLAEVKALRLKNACGARGSRIQVPTLEEIMLAAKGKIMINLDKTEGETLKEAYEVLVKTETVDHAIFKADNSYPELREKYGDLLDSIIFMPKLRYNNENVEKHLADYEAGINPFMYETLFDSEEANTFQLLPELKKQGDTFLAIALWDELVAGHTDEMALLEGADAAWGWLIEEGANGIMTDRPEMLLAYLRAKNLHD